MSLRERKTRALHGKDLGEQVSGHPYSFAVQPDELIRLIDHIRSVDPTVKQLDKGKRAQHVGFKDVVVALCAGNFC